MMKNDVSPTASIPEPGASPCKEKLRQKFESGARARYLAAKEIEELLEQAFLSLASPPTIKVRTKRFESYYKKYLDSIKAGISEPRITDLIGIRIVCPFIEDISLAEGLVKTLFEVVEVDHKGHYTFKEFGYESTHLLIKIPEDIVKRHKSSGCSVTEIQIRTILQDAWAEVEHELFYKAAFNPFDTPMKRKLAAVNASLSLADIVFQEIRFYQKQLNSQLEKRRDTFHQKVEESTDGLLFSGMPAQKAYREGSANIDLDRSSIDDLLLDALKAHNENRFSEAIAVYTRILELKPEQQICSLIYKHRGMANFAQSKYHDAVSDFTSSIDLDSKSYKAAYYRGVVHSVLKQYQEAIDDFTLSLGINPFQAFCLFRRGQAYYHIGDHPHALADCEASLSMEPANETTKKFRDLLQNKLKM
ncbi:MAG: tetratricopeptide repeat protein [Treponema sp.]|jgi:putative GTP pyrophosphokinase|nr:tetratricopeptide repeat protein [Treponema sp.]